DHLPSLERVPEGLGLLTHLAQLGVARSRGLDRGQKISLTKRLHQVPEDAGIDRSAHQAAFGERREHHDWYLLMLEYLACRFDAVEFRHLHVHHGEIDLMLLS